MTGQILLIKPPAGWYDRQDVLPTAGSDVHITVITCVTIVTGMWLSPCQAAWISEIWLEPQDVLDDQFQPTTVPPLVEVSGLDPQKDADLILIDAKDSPTRYSKVKTIITLTAGSNIRAVTQDTFPDTYMTHVLNRGQVYQSLGPGETFSFTGSRALLLFDEPTGLAGFTGRLEDVEGLADPLDVVTLDWQGQARQHPLFTHRPIIDATLGPVIARPNIPEQSAPWPTTYHSGAVSPGARLHGSFGDYQVNPGDFNDVWSPAGPEPATATMLIVLWLSAWSRPGRQLGHAGGKRAGAGL